MKRVQRYARGSVRFDRRRKTWNYLWYEAGKRRSKRIGTKQEYPTKAAAWSAAEEFTQAIANGRVTPRIGGQNARDPLPRREDAKAH